MAVPVFALDRARSRVEAEVRSRWDAVMEKTAFVGGFEVETFERGFADYLGAAGTVGVGNGTDALTLALRSLCLGPDDEVVVPALSFYATAESVVLAGAVPVFADVLPETLNVDADSVAAKLSSRTRAVVGVHLYGRPFDVAGVRQVCAERDLPVIEDAAQAHGARYRGQCAGTLGELAAWSFYPSKNLGCFGDGGAVTSPDVDRLAEVRLQANHGLIGRYRFSRIGTNSRLDALQAAVLNARLVLLEQDNDRRREIAARYHSEFAPLSGLRCLEDHPEDLPVYHQMTVLCERRDELQQFLADRGVGSSVHYPEPLHRVPPMVDRVGDVGRLPVAEAAVEQILCLPIFPELTDDEQTEVCDAVRAFF